MFHQKPISSLKGEACRQYDIHITNLFYVLCAKKVICKHQSVKWGRSEWKIEDTHFFGDGRVKNGP